ncbi:MAG: hypothetical protein KGN78_01125 [Actinomycetales bacterium]|nr:hypothetical protein [Actinomycetales bacterium]
MVHIMGAIGSVIVLLAYFLVTTGKVTSSSWRFQGMNLVGSVLLTIYSFALAAWAAVPLNGTWVIIAAVALTRMEVRRRRASARAGATP